MLSDKIINIMASWLQRLHVDHQSLLITAVIFIKTGSWLELPCVPPKPVEHSCHILVNDILAVVVMYRSPYISSKPADHNCHILNKGVLAGAATCKSSKPTEHNCHIFNNGVLNAVATCQLSKSVDRSCHIFHNGVLARDAVYINKSVLITELSCLELLCVQGITKACLLITAAILLIIVCCPQLPRVNHQRTCWT